MTTRITRPRDSRRHIYQISGTHTDHEDVMTMIKGIAGEEKVARMTGAEFASLFSSRHLEGKEVLIVDGILRGQITQFKNLISAATMYVNKQHQESHLAPNTIRYIFYTAGYSLTE